ncbi:MAG: flagellar basal body-associated FliL family protein [Pigmentiphaga sp.]|nr:flagellar basal body-associated FliL family protein [Pigmentiphaga sp.]
MFHSSTNRGIRFVSRFPARQRGALGKPLLALTALAILAASATAITYLITQNGSPIGSSLLGSSQASAESGPALPAAPAIPLFLRLEPFTVTIANDRAERLMHVGVVFTISSEAARKHLTDVLPVVRSRILLLLSEQNPDTINTSAAKQHLERAIRNLANESLNPSAGQQVDQVLFTDFVVQ